MSKCGSKLFASASGEVSLGEGTPELAAFMLLRWQSPEHMGGGASTRTQGMTDGHVVGSPAGSTLGMASGVNLPTRTRVSTSTNAPPRPSSSQSPLSIGDGTGSGTESSPQRPKTATKCCGGVPDRGGVSGCGTAGGVGAEVTMPGGNLVRIFHKPSRAFLHIDTVSGQPYMSSDVELFALIDQPGDKAHLHPTPGRLANSSALAQSIFELIPEYAFLQVTRRRARTRAAGTPPSPRCGSSALPNSSKLYTSKLYRSHGEGAGCLSLRGFDMATGTAVQRPGPAGCAGVVSLPGRSVLPLGSAGRFPTKQKSARHQVQVSFEAIRYYSQAAGSCTTGVGGRVSQVQVAENAPPAWPVRTLGRPPTSPVLPSSNWEASQLDLSDLMTGGPLVIGSLLRELPSNSNMASIPAPGGG